MCLYVMKMMDYESFFKNAWYNSIFNRRVHWYIQGMVIDSIALVLGLFVLDLLLLSLFMHDLLALGLLMTG